MEAFFLSLEREFPKEEIKRNMDRSYIKIELSAMSSFFISPEEMKTQRGGKIWEDMLEYFYLL